MIPVPNQLKYFLQNAKDISLGYREISFTTINDLEDFQVGYRTDTNGRLLVKEEPGYWQESWVVIAVDDIGDPLFADTGLPQMPVFTAMTGAGYWTAEVIAVSLDDFLVIINRLYQLSKHRGSPAELEENPLSKKEQVAFLKAVKEANGKVVLPFWESFFDD